MKRCLTILIFLAALGAPSAPQSAELCVDAAQRYAACVGEILGREMAALARSKQPMGVAACGSEVRTQQMYQQCLPQKGCAAFFDCLDGFAAASSPGSAPVGGPNRKAQCREHIRMALRGVALSLPGFSESRSEASKSAAQGCIFDAQRPLADCLDAQEWSELVALAEQRQRDCEAWPADVAACALRLPGRKDCAKKERLWRAPIEQGAPGPAVTGSVPLEEADSDEPTLAWADRGILIIADATGLRALRSGQVLWRSEKGKERVWVGSAHVLAREGPRGLWLIEAESGKAQKLTLPDEIRGADRAPDGTFLLLSGGGQLSVLNPSVCATRGGACLSPLVTLATNDLPYELSVLHVLPGKSVLLASTDAVQLFKPDGKRSFRMALSSSGMSFVSFLPPEHVAVADDAGVALLSLEACQRLGPELYLPSTMYAKKSVQTSRARPPNCPRCKLATPPCLAGFRVSLSGSWMFPSPLSGAAVSFNDHAVIEKTHYLRPGGGWTVKTGGYGTSTGDERHVYVISNGIDGEGPVRLLALSRESGRGVWQTELPGAATQHRHYPDVQVIVREGLLAARVGSRIYLLRAP